MENYMKLKNFYLAEPQIKALQKHSKETGISASEIVRRALDKYLEEKELKKGRDKQ